ncbi:MAG TPA: hypothetical protein VGC76_10990 [Pyrinomonadaceae bacterium]|jgi:hypothetical protein
MWKRLSLILFFAVTAAAQTPENLYVRSLKACLEKEIEEYSKFTERDLYNVFVVKDDKLTYDLPTQIGKINLEYLDYVQLARKFKAQAKTKYKNRGKIPVIEIYRISDKGNKLLFGYHNFWFEYAEKGGFFSKKKILYNFALEGGCNVEIGFDSAQQKFVIEKVELWGV